MDRRLLEIAHALNLSEGKSNDHLLAVRATKLRTISRYRLLAWQMYGRLRDRHARAWRAMSEIGQFDAWLGQRGRMAGVVTAICDDLKEALFSWLKRLVRRCKNIVYGSFSLYSPLDHIELDISNKIARFV